VHKCSNVGAYIVSSTMEEAFQMICEYLKDQPW